MRMRPLHRVPPVVIGVLCACLILPAPGYSISSSHNLQSLISDLHNGDQHTRLRACLLLGGIGPAAGRARGPLQDVLGVDPVSYVRYKAAEALGKIGDPKAIPALVDALRDRQGYVRSGILTSLGYLKEGTGKGEDALIGVLINRLVLDGDNPLILTDFTVRDREISALSLGRLRSQKAVPSLVVSLKDPDWRVRRSSAFALGLILGPSSVHPLQALQGAAVSPATQGFPVLQPLREAMEDPNALVSYAATWAHWRITKDPGRPPEFPTDRKKIYDFLRKNGLLILVHD